MANEATGVVSYAEHGFTNESATCLLTIEKVPGPIKKLGPAEKAFEIHEFNIHGWVPVLPGATGLLEKNGAITMSNLVVVIQASSALPNLMQACYHGTDVGKVTVHYLTNIGNTNEPLLTITLTNARLREVADNILYDTTKSHNNLDIFLGDLDFAKSRKDLVHLTNEYMPTRHVDTAARLQFIYDTIEVKYDSYEDSGAKGGSVVTTVNLAENTVK